MIPLIIIFALFGWGLFVIALSTENKWLGYMAGTLILVVGIFSTIYGIGELNSWITRIFGVIHMGVGIATIIIAGFEEIQDDE